MYNFLRINSVIVLGILCSVDIYATQLIQGNANPQTGTSFLAPMGIMERDNNSGYIFAASAGEGNQDFSIARFVPQMPGTPQFIGMTPQTIQLNGQPNTSSPLFNNGMSFLKPMAGRYVVAVPTALPNNVFLLTDLLGLSALNINGVNDGAGLPTTAVVGLTIAANNIIFAAVNDATQDTFGIGNSGIALIDAQERIAANEARIPALVQQDLQGNPSQANPRAAILNIDSAAVGINAPVASMGISIIDMAWSPYLQCLYIAYLVQGAADDTDGARSIVVASVVNNQLNITPIAPNGVFTPGAQNEIIGGIGLSALITANKVRIMRTSTRLDYLIVLGGNVIVFGDRDDGLPSSTVYALPLVNLFTPQNMNITSVNLAAQGTLADVTTTPTVYYTPTNTVPSLQLFGSRSFTTPATTPAGIYTDESIQAQVGGGYLAAGTITDIIVAGDAIFAIVGTPDEGQRAAIYYSQPIFNAGRYRWMDPMATSMRLFRRAFFSPI